MRIGALATAAGCSPKTIRFYEDYGLLPAPPRTPGGYRDYPDHAVARLMFIRDAQAAGLSLAEIGDVLAVRDGGQPPCVHVAELIAAHLAQVETRIAELRATRRALRELSQRAASTNPGDCTDSDICRILTHR
jgi:MerR family transcriptional regulator, copper efflux regulator